MKTNHFLTCFLCLSSLLLPSMASAQIETDSPVHVYADGQLSLSDLDLTGTLFHIEAAITAADCLIDLPRATDIEIASGLVTLSIDTIDRIVFTSGMADLRRNLYLTGDIIGETDRATFTTAEPLISKCIVLPALHETETGLGLSLTASNSLDAIVISRANRPTGRRDQESVARYYTFSSPVTLSAASLSCPAAHLSGMENPMLYYRNTTSQAWMQVYESGPSGTDHVTGLKIGTGDGLTVFDANDLYFPAYFTPNGDGINDRFEIENSYRYADSRLVVMTRDGKVVYDKSPYRNDFDGGDLKPDTYYFIFYKSADDKKPARQAVDIYR